MPSSCRQVITEVVDIHQVKVSRVVILATQRQVKIFGVAIIVTRQITIFAAVHVATRQHAIVEGTALPSAAIQWSRASHCLGPQVSTLSAAMVMVACLLAPR